MIGYLGCTKHSTNDKFMQDLDICFDVETLNEWMYISVLGLCEYLCTLNQYAKLVGFFQKPVTKMIS